MANEIQELRERKARLMAEIELIDQYLRLHGKLFPSSSGENKSDTKSPHSNGADNSQRNDPRAVAERANQVLRQHGRPMQRGDLVRAIEDSGLEIFSKDKNKYIGTVLWRHRDTFVNIEDRGYWIRGLNIETEPVGFSFDN